MARWGPQVRPSPASATPAAGSPPPLAGLPRRCRPLDPPVRQGRGHQLLLGRRQQLRDAICDFAGDSRHANPWAADLYMHPRQSPRTRPPPRRACPRPRLGRHLALPEAMDGLAGFGGLLRPHPAPETLHTRLRDGPAGATGTTGTTGDTAATVIAAFVAVLRTITVQFEALAAPQRRLPRGEHRDGFIAVVVGGRDARAPSRRIHDPHTPVITPGEPNLRSA